MNSEIILRWAGLKAGPVVCNTEPIDSQNHRMSFFFENPGNDPEYWKLIQGFELKYPNHKSPTFAEDFETYASQNGYAVTQSDYDENGIKSYDRIGESMTTDEADEFIRRLKAGEVNFKFRKVDGSIREARGTLSQDLIPTRPSEERIDGARRTHRVPDSVIVYWDLDKNAFRSFKKDNFEGYVE